MESKYSYIYESHLNEGFERSIMSGHLSEAKVTEMYDKGELSDAQKLVAEGFYDRLKARGAQALGAARGAGQRIAGGAKQAYGNALQSAGNLAAKGVQAVGGQIDPSQNSLINKGQALSSQGAEQSASGSSMGNAAKYQSYMSNTVATIINDLKQLGIPVANPQQLSKELSQVLVRNIKGTQAVQQQSPVNQPSFNAGQSGNSMAYQRPLKTTRQMRAPK